VRRYIAGLVSGIIFSGVAFAQTRLSFELIEGEDAKYIEKKSNGLEFGTMLWLDKDRVLILDYGGKRFLLSLFRDQRG
jgi:hypothetical protein